MAAIIDDGPREWISDTLNRTAGRVLAVAAGVAMLWSVQLLDPGRLRLGLAAGAVLLIGRACWPRLTQPGVTVADLAEIEAVVMRLVERFDDHKQGADTQHQVLLGLVREIRSQLR